MADDTILSKIKDVATGSLKGATTDLVGLPVDMISEVLKAVGVPIPEKPIGGSKNLREILGQNAEDKNIYETVGTFISPEGAAKAMIVAAARIPSRLKDAHELLNAAEAAPWVQRTGRKIENPELYEQTGVYRNKDQKLKTAISDKSARLRGGFQRTLGEQLDHPVLFSLYPELKSIPLHWGEKPNSGSMAVDNSRMNLSQVYSTPEQKLSVILHETQHAIQHIENFGRGGNTEQFLKFDVASVNEKLARARKSGDVAQIQAADRFAKKLSVHLDEARNRYLNLPGEQEARYTQETSKFTNTELANDIKALLQKGDTPQTFDTRPIRPIP